MEFCGGCGTELARGLDRGRFCAECGHENPGNARYPLYAEATAPAAPPAGASGTESAMPTTAKTAVAMPAADVTSVRLEAVPATTPVTTQRSDTEAVSAPTAWRITLLAALAAMLVVVLLGVALLML